MNRDGIVDHVSSVKPKFRRLTSFLLTRVSIGYAEFYLPQQRNVGSTKPKSTELIHGFSLTDDQWIVDGPYPSSSIRNRMDFTPIHQWFPDCNHSAIHPFYKKMAGPQHHIFQSLRISYRLMPFHPRIITETPLPTRVSGVMKKGGLKPRKPCKTPGLSNGAFLKNPAKRPDSIGAGMGEETSKGVHFDFFRSCVSFRFKPLIQR